MRAPILMLLVFSFGGLLRADTLTFTAMPTAGQFEYQFTLLNSGTTGGTLFDLFLYLPTDIANIDTGTIGTPVGWGDSTGGLLFFGPDVNPSTSFIEWAADFNGLYDTGIGTSLTGFSFLSSQRIGNSILFAVNGSNTFDSAQEVSGVPEPTTFGLVFFAITVILAGFKFDKEAHVGATDALTALGPRRGYCQINPIVEHAGSFDTPVK